MEFNKINPFINFLSGILRDYDSIYFCCTSSIFSVNIQYFSEVTVYMTSGRSDVK